MIEKEKTLRQNNKNIYWAWKAMKQRCLNPKNKAYYNYGGRGITVCNEWLKFEAFCDWSLKNGYKQGLELDRKDNDGNYEPSNCHWTTRKENINNRRCSHFIDVDGVKKTISQWSDELSIDNALIYYWIKHSGTDYAVSRIKEIQLKGYKPKDYARNHTKEITHVETQITFESVKKAAEYFGIGKSTISNAMRINNGITAKGRFEWKDISVK